MAEGRPDSPSADAGAVRGLVFDLDDTLYPQVEFKRSGFREIARWVESRHGIAADQSLAALEKILKEKGPSYHHMFDDLMTGWGLECDCVPEMVAVFNGHAPRISLYPGVSDMLARLRQRSKIGVLTDGPEAVQQGKIDALDLAGRVDAILCSASMGLEKPAPALFEWFEQDFQLPGEELVHVGDNPHKDFVGARARGWLTVRVLTGEHAEVVPRRGYDAEMTVQTVLDVGEWAWRQAAP